MEIVLSFVIGLLLAGFVAFFVLRSVKSAAADAQRQALLDAAKQAELAQKAAVAKLETELKNAQDNLEQSKSDAAKHTQELLAAKDEAHKDAMDAMEKRHAAAIEAECKRYADALTTMREQVQNATNQMLKERQAELQQSNSTNMKQIVDPLKESIAKMERRSKRTNPRRRLPPRPSKRRLPRWSAPQCVSKTVPID